MDYWTKRRLSRRRAISTFAGSGAGIAGLLVAGCGDDDDDAKPVVPATGAAGATSAASASPSGAATAAGQPRRGGTLKLTQPQFPNFDTFGSSTGSLHSNGGPGCVLSRLVHHRVPDDPLSAAPEVLPDLALNWETPDDTTVNFRLRPGVKWQNIAPVSGRELVAEDIKLSLERQLKSPTSSFLGPVASVTAVNPLTLQVKLSRPDTEIIVQLGESRNKIVPRESLAGDLKVGPIIGTGAWVFDSAERDRKWRLKGNPDYYDKSQPYFDAVEVFVIPDRPTALNSVQQGQIDHYNLNSFQEVSQFSDTKKFVIRQYEMFNGINLLANTKSQKLADPRVRQAISKLVDRKALANVAYQGKAWNAPNIILPDRSHVLPDAELQKFMARDVKESQALLKAAGAENLEIEILFVGSAFAALAEAIVPHFSDAGMKAILKPVTVPEYNARVATERRYDAYLGTVIVGSVANADLLLRFHSSGAQNSPGISDAELDQLIEGQSREKNKDTRKKMLQDVQRKSLGLAGWIPLLSPTQFEVIRKGVNLPGQVTNNVSFEYWQYQSGWLDA